MEDTLVPDELAEPFSPADQDREFAFGLRQLAEFIEENAGELGLTDADRRVHITAFVEDLDDVARRVPHAQPDSNDAVVRIPFNSGVLYVAVAR